MIRRRICLHGGPGCGKSTVAAWLFSSMKAENVEVEYVTEYVKNWTFLRRPPEGFDQIYLFGKQMNREDVVLRYDDEFVIVTDSPLFLSCCYAEKYETIGWQHLWGIARDFEQVYPSVNILLSRPESYTSKGRFQDEAQAKEMDAFCKHRLLSEGLNLVELPCTKLEEIKKFVESSITPRF